MTSTPVRKSKSEKTRTCKDCGKRKDLHKFEKDRRLPGGRTQRCRDCATEAQQGWRKDQSKAWKERERKRIREAVRALRRKKASKKGR